MRIDRLRIQTADPAALSEFYARAFGAEPAALGFTLGAERIELALCAGDSDAFASNETGFQHFALVVDDIAAAYAHLQSQSGWRPISLAGPELLPPDSGGARAFKFRDPEGRPLELLQFAPSAIPAIWRQRFAATPGRLFHGIDHTGLSVSDGAASRDFFVAVGFVASPMQLNRGQEQARLDGFAADAEVAITSLSPPDGARPGVELLAYRRPAPAARAASDTSLAATCIVIADPAGLARPRADPDGHRLVYQSTLSLS